MVAAVKRHRQCKLCGAHDKLTPCSEVLHASPMRAPGLLTKVHASQGGRWRNMGGRACNGRLASLKDNKVLQRDGWSTGGARTGPGCERRPTFRWVSGFIQGIPQRCASAHRPRRRWRSGTACPCRCPAGWGLSGRVSDRSTPPGARSGSQLSTTCPRL